MRIKVVPGDFLVEEQVHLALTASGPWAAYRVRKVGLTTPEVQTCLASTLKLSREQVIFPALKDKEAVAIQFAVLPMGLAEVIEGVGFRAQRVGFLRQPLRPADLRGNAFTILLRDLAEGEAARVAQRLDELGRYGLPNYFDQQRFGSLTPNGDFIGKAIIRRDAEGALRAHFTQPFLGDPRVVLAFKRTAATLWPDWPAMLEAAPRPSNYRSVLTYLAGHPQDFRKALNLIPQRLLSLYLAAYQSYLWNRITGAYLVRLYQRNGVQALPLTIAGQALPLHIGPAGQLLAELSSLRIALPSHQATFQAEVAGIVQGVLAAEGLALDDLKARILKKAYLAKGSRAVLLIPKEMRVDAPLADERFPGRLKLLVRFVLSPGSYATLLLKAASLPLPESGEGRGEGQDHVCPIA